MSIEQVRSSLTSDDLKVFNDVLSYCGTLDDSTEPTIIDFRDVKNFIIRHTFQLKPNTGLICISDGKIANTVCY